MYTKANLAALRVKKDIAELSQHRLNATHASTSIDFPDGTRNLLKLKVGVSMTAGLYEGTTFYFILTIPPSYPFHAPTVVCTTRAWHPNIDLHTGLVSLPILSNDWRPVLSINTVVFALQLMFIEPTEHYPVNEPAATALKNNPSLFREQVRFSLSGGLLFGVQFESHRQGLGNGGAGGPGAAQKRKRGIGESMDTEAVQTTLEAMRIQGDEIGAELSSSTWDKRPRHQQGGDISSLGQQHHRHQAEDEASKPPQSGLQFMTTGGVAAGQHQRPANFSESNSLGMAIEEIGGLPQQQQQQQQQQIAFGNNSSDGAAFDRLRCHTIEEVQRSAAAATATQATPPAVGLRCGVGVGGVGVGQSAIGVSQPPATVVGEGVGTTMAWGVGGPFQVQTVPTSGLR